MPDQASCARTTRARMPPTNRNEIVKIRYMMPIFLWSVVSSHASSPACSWCAPWTGLAIASVATLDHPRVGTSPSLVREIENRKHEHPDDVDEVPVKN